MKYLGFIGSLLIVIALISFILYTYQLIPGYVTISIFAPSILAGVILTLASIIWLTYIYSIKYSLKYLFFSIVSFILFIVFLFLGLSLVNYAISKLFYILSVISFIMSIIFAYIFFRHIYQNTDIYTFYLAGKFILWALIAPIIFFGIFWFVTSAFYKIDFVNPYYVKYFSDFKLITALFFAWLVFYSMIVVSFIFLTIAFLYVDASKEEERIKQEMEEELSE
jgi:hypothetical protein